MSMGKGKEWGTEGDVRRERKRTGNVKRGGRREQGGQRGSEEKRRPLVRIAAEYQETYGGGGVDYIWRLQYPERAQRGAGVGTLGNGPGQHGHWNLTENQVYRWNLHPRVGWVQPRRYGRAELTPLWSGRVLSAVTTVCGGGCALVWPQRHHLQLTTGAQWWYIIGCYLAPDNTSTIESVVAALKERPRGAALLVAGYLNTMLTETGKRPKGNKNCGDTDGRGI